MVWAWIVIAAFFGIWIGVAVYGKTQQWSGIYRFGGGFIAACVVVGVGFSMIGNEYAKNAPQVEAAPPAKAVPAAPVWFDEKKGPIATPVADPGVANKP